MAFDLVCSTYRSFFLCTVQLVVQGTLAVLDAATEAIADAVKAAGQAIELVLRTLMNAAQGTADVATDTLNGVLGLFGQHIQAPQWSEPAAMQVLRNITLPPALVHPFQELSTQLPTVDSLRAATKDTFHSAVADVQGNVNRSVAMVSLRMPPRVPMSDAAPVCAQMNWAPLDACHAAVRRAASWGYIAVALGALLAFGLGVCAYGLPAMRTSYPTYGRRVGAHFIAALGTPLVVFVLAALLLHLGVVQVQLGTVHVLLQQIRELPTLPDVPWPVVQVGQDAADAANAQLGAAQDEINRALSGSMHHLVPGALDTLNAVLDLLSGTIRDLLGGTPMQGPVSQFAMCIVGNKIAAAEHALVLLQSALHLTLPTLATPTLPTTTLLQPVASALARDVFQPLTRVLQSDAAQLSRDRLVLGLVLAGSVCALLFSALVHAQERSLKILQ